MSIGHRYKLHQCFFFFFFFLFGFYGPFKNISLISSRSFIKGGRKPENPEKNHLTIRKQNLAFQLHQCIFSHIQNSDPVKKKSHKFVICYCYDKHSKMSFKCIFHLCTADNSLIFFEKIMLDISCELCAL